MTTKRKSPPVKAKKPVIEPTPKMELLIDVVLDLDTRLSDLKNRLEWDTEITDENAEGLLARVNELEVRSGELERELGVLSALLKEAENKEHYKHPSFGLPPSTLYDKSVPYWYGMYSPTYTHD